MKLANIELPQKINLNNVDLFLNGAAIRSKFFLQTYIVSLYSAEKITDEKILPNDFYLYLYIHRHTYILFYEEIRIYGLHYPFDHMSRLIVDMDT